MLLLVAQVIPYGRDHTNPPVTRAVAWDTARTEQLVAGACLDCHSNLTDWKWYSNIAPASWLVYRDVEEGRGELNFSEWNRPQAEADEIVEAVQEGSMPPLQYKLVHSSARLSSEERDELVRGLQRTLAQDPPTPADGERESEDDD
ncbi:MAG: heme-binding domain-containing protein [Gaiellaceae bacterium]